MRIHFLTRFVLAWGLLGCIPMAVQAYAPVVTPNGSTLDFTMEQGIKVFRLSVDVIKHEMAPGMIINAWGYNGQTPGPTLEAREGDRVRIWVKNNLPEPTAVHWHGILLPNGMDGVSGLTQRGIQPGETFRYEFTLKQHGTFMYHSHGDEMVQMGLGTMGFFVIHPKSEPRKIDRDYALMVNEWFVPPGASTPNPSIMTDFNLFTFNSRIFPGTAPLLARPGDRVRIRIGNVGQEDHPIHIHGHQFKVVSTDGGDIPPAAQWSETTVLVAPGQTRTFEFIATEGDWPLHCHKRHHPMNAMGHQFPNLIGVDQAGVEDKISAKVPGYMAMGQKGMEEMTTMGMEGPANTIPMMAGDGPFGPIGMGGMFTIVKVHADAPRFATAAEYTAKVKGPADYGWYKHPLGTVADTVNVGLQDGKPGKIPSQKPAPSQATGYTCPMHPEVHSDKPGNCPKCGMKLVPMTREQK
jgi:manganese oxidase